MLTSKRSKNINYRQKHLRYEKNYLTSFERCWNVDNILKRVFLIMLTFAQLKKVVTFLFYSFVVYSQIQCGDQNIKYYKNAIDFLYIYFLYYTRNLSIMTTNQ